ncbi:hypothetical protein B9L21_09650 [Geobacillus uzenensis]|uniref:Uncharacterized protein n=1 Tax=Geobacillus uzenensis TaxID=129339 RepID=A0ABX4DHA7_9BACL|nr:hypothetical protein A5418_13375 [Geobacillus subterraneus]OXB88124.1 hypothetical protein B9L21_09650 [Geobacillus uzenensis]
MKGGTAFFALGVTVHHPSSEPIHVCNVSPLEKRKDGASLLVHLPAFPKDGEKHVFLREKETWRPSCFPN